MNKLSLKIIFISILLVSLSACKSNGNSVAYCSDVRPVNYHQTLEEVKWHLQNKRCHYKFGTYFHDLLSAASGDPGPQYEQKFEQFLSWSQNQNIVSRKDKQALMSEYFQPHYTGLDAYSANTCDYSSRQTEIFAMLDDHAAKKRIGIRDVLGNTLAYQKSSTLNKDIQRVLEAVWFACDTTTGFNKGIKS